MINIEKEDSEKVGYDNRKLEESNARADQHQCLILTIFN